VEVNPQALRRVAAPEATGDHIDGITLEHIPIG
jgi:hypothetical protein